MLLHGEGCTVTQGGRGAESDGGGPAGQGHAQCGLSAEQQALVDFTVEYYRRHGHTPNLRTLVNELGVDKKRIYVLFPGNPVRRICQIAGLPMPPEC
jgi:tRNA 2-thiouridine synthesizing protein E